MAEQELQKLLKEMEKAKQSLEIALRQREEALSKVAAIKADLDTHPKM